MHQRIFFALSYCIFPVMLAKGRIGAKVFTLCAMNPAWKIPSCKLSLICDYCSCISLIDFLDVYERNLVNRGENLNFFLKALLVDIGADKSLPHTSECENRPLIDLSNTPEVSKITSPKPVLSGQIKVSFI